MTTKAAGGKITGLLALTCEAQEALAVRDWVHLVGDYEVEKADGTKPVLGVVSVSNKGRNPATGAYPASIVPGDVTIEARGFYVSVLVSGGAIDAGEPVGYDGTAVVQVVDGAINQIGVALTGTVGAGEDLDVLVN